MQTLQNNLSKITDGFKHGLKFVKDNAKVGAMIIGLSAGVYFVGKTTPKAYGGELRVYNRSDVVTYGNSYLKHIEGATESYDNGMDSEWLESPNTLQIYSYNPNCLPTTDKLSTDARDSNSLTTFNLELYNKGFQGTANNYLRFRIYDNNNFEWKNIFLCGANDSNDVIADVKNLIAVGGGTFGRYDLPDVQGSQTGVYDKRKIIPKNHADLNRDNKVNFKDYAIYANEWQNSGSRFGSNVGSDPNDLGAYADIDRTGTVDYEDLGYMTDEWLDGN